MPSHSKYSRHLTFLWTILSTFLLIQSAIASVATPPLPDLGSPDLVQYDSQTETALGRAFSTELNTQYDLVKDPETLAFIRRIGRKIISQTQDPHPFKFYLLNNPEINAFAGPNGIIGLHSGLILATQTEDELASVMAHEIAHVTQHHLSRSFDYQGDLNIGSIATLIAAILVGTQNPSAGIATYMGGMGLAIQQQLKNSRIHEHEADYIGIKYLQKAGYNPFAMGSFFGRLSKAAQLNEFQPPEILMTHPVTATRLAQANDRARQFPPFKNKDRYTTLNLIKVRIQSTRNHPIKTTPYEILKMDANTLCYQQSLNQLTQNTPIKQIPTCLRTAAKTHPKERLFPLMIAQYQLKLSPQKALKKLKYLFDIYPEDSSILYRYADALYQTGQTKQATQILEKNIPHHQHQKELYQRLASIYNQQKQFGLAYYYKALGQINIGNLKYALHLLKKSKDLLKNTKSQRSLKINQLIATLKLKNKKENKNNL